MIQSNEYYISKEFGGDDLARGVEFHLKTASLVDETVKVVWTKSLHKAKRFDGTYAVQRFVKDCKIENAYITSIVDSIVIEVMEIET